MGVRGLTTYIAQHADCYLDPFELHDCNLVIDGDSLSSNLYKSASHCNSAFGGNYDQFFRTVCNFFEMLKQCNVTAYVLLDGGYLPKKLNTVRQRLRSKIGAIKYLNPFRCQPMFPIMMREVFVEAMQHCEVKFMRCVFEADDEVAALSRKLKCPVLSYDSDFYIHNVAYIPSVTLTLKVYRRNVSGKSPTGHKIRKRKDLVQEMTENGECCRLKTKKVEEDLASPERTCYYYMQCSVYRIKNLVRDRHLRAEMLPLFAVLLGNDYINSSLFNKFYSNVSMKQTGKNNSQQGKRIVALLRWLQHETLESAMAKIIGYVEKEKKEWLMKKMTVAMCGYSQEKSATYDFFGFSDLIQTASDELESVKHISTEFVEIDTEVDVDQPLDGEIDTCELNDDSDDGVDKCSTSSSHSEHSEEIDDDLENCNSQPVDHESYEDVANLLTPPEWLYPKLLGARLPRYVIDLLHLKLYINSPQVENFELPDCNLIAMPILQLIFTVLHFPHKPEMRYLTRVQRRTDIEYKKFNCINQDIYFDCTKDDNYETFKLILNDFENRDEIFMAIERAVPNDLRLFFVAIIYWSKHSDHFNVVYASSLLFCLIVLRVIDSKLQPIRNRSKFERIYKPKENKQKTSKKSEASTAQTEVNVDKAPRFDELLAKITKDECILAQANLLDLFEVSGKLREKHTQYSSDILHGFAEFQSIVYQINCLNVLCGEHFPNVQMSNCYNGCFLYNMYVTLKERPNIKYYIENFLFLNSAGLLRLYEAMMCTLTPFVECLASVTISKRKKRRNINKKVVREQRKNVANELAATEANVEHSGSDFEDLNNKFSCLLKT